MLDPTKQVYLGELSTSGENPRVKWTLTGAYTPGTLSDSILEEKMTLQHLSYAGDMTSR